MHKKVRKEHIVNPHNSGTHNSGQNHNRGPNGSAHKTIKIGTSKDQSFSQSVMKYSYLSKRFFPESVIISFII